VTRFWSKVNKSGDCWLWTAGTDQHGYGRFWYRGTMMAAHRLSYELAFGEAPQGGLLHSCDTPSCVRPSHLRQGNQADNMRDAVNKGRQARGERMNSAKLTQADVLAIRELSKAGAGRSDLGRRFGVSQTTIRRASTGECWGWL
jgi:hypothetical protein